MKKTFYLLLVVLLSLLFTSCIDYVQSISFKDGKYQLYYKITLSKVLFAMSGENPDEFLDMLNEDTEGLPENARLNTVNTDLEVGMEFFLSI